MNTMKTSRAFEMLAEESLAAFQNIIAGEYNQACFRLGGMQVIAVHWEKTARICEEHHERDKPQEKEENWDRMKRVMKGEE